MQTTIDLTPAGTRRFMIENHLAYVGDRVIINCQSTDYPVWKKYSEVLENPRTYKNNLILSNVQESDRGAYYCSDGRLELHLLVAGNWN